MNKSKEPFGINPSGEGDSWESLAGDLFGIDFDGQSKPEPIDIDDLLSDEIEESPTEETPTTEPKETESQETVPVVENNPNLDDNHFGSFIFDDDESSVEPVAESPEESESDVDFDFEEEEEEEDIIEAFDDDEEDNEELDGRRGN